MRSILFCLLGVSRLGLVHAGPTRRGGYSSAPFSAFVVFGDSYTDQGIHSYIPAANGSLPPPSTNASTGGRVWPEYVKQYTGVNVYDYAVDGGLCNAVFSDQTRSGIQQDQMPSFLTDNSYVSNVTGEPALDNPSDSTYYAIWIGTNDLGHLGFLTEVQPKGLPLTNYTDCVFDQFDTLYAVGARHFVLLNVAPLDLTPLYALPENGGVSVSQFWPDKLQYDSNITRTSEKMREYSTLANAVFEYEIPFQVKIARRYPKSSFTLFDVHSLLTDIWNHPALYLNGTLPLNVTGFIQECSADTCASLAARDSYMWYNELHPSEQTDRIIARELVHVIDGHSKWATYWRDF